MSFNRCKALFRNKKLAAVLLSLSLLLAASLGTTIAYLMANTDDTVNVFTPGEVQTEIEEDFDGEVKENVTVKNTGNVDAYLRAAIVVTWQDEEGNILASVPVLGTDYEMTLGTDTGWFQAEDGYYYYSRPVPAGGKSGILIESCKPLVEKEGCVLSVEILSSAIQSTPADAVTEAWGVTVDADGILSK